MPRPAENINLKQIATCFIQTSNSLGGSSTTEWSREVSRMQSVRPRSSSNPVRKDGSRAESSWSRTATRTDLGNGLYNRLETDPKGNWWKTQGTGQVTVRRQSGSTIVDHTLAKQILNDSRMKALAGLSASKSQFNVAAREAKGTIRTLSDFCQQAARGVRTMGRQLSKRDPRYYLPPGSWKKAPGNYLAYLYGLKPLADDIGNGLDQLSGLSKRNMSFGYTVRAGGRQDLQFDESVSTPAFVNPFNALNCRRVSVARVGYHYSFPDWWIQDVPIVTPFSDAWELTRLSFVLDWVLPVGNWIGAMEAAQFDPYFRSGFEVYATEETIRGPFTPTQTSSTNKLDISMSNDGYSDRRYQMVRTALGPESNPSRRVSFPSFRDYLGLDHAAQSLALLSQAFSKPPSRY